MGADGFWRRRGLVRTGAASAVAAAKSWPVVPGVTSCRASTNTARRPSKSGSRGATMYERKVSSITTSRTSPITSVHGSFAAIPRATSRWVLRLFGMDFQEGGQRAGLGQSGQSVGGDAQSPASLWLAAVADRSGVIGAEHI